MLIKTLVLITCAVLPIQAMEFGIGAVGNIGIGFSRYETDVRDETANLVTDHLSSRAPVFGLGPMVNFWFNDNFGLNMCLQYSLYNYNYTYDYATSEAAIELRWSIQSLILPADLKIAIPFGKNRAFIGGGVIVSKQLKGKEGGIIWGNDLEAWNMRSEELKTDFLLRALIGVEFCSGNIGYQTSIDYYQGLYPLFVEPWASTHHLSLSFAVLYYPGKGNGSD
ncbi:outer membrane beta-barrel protein [candidate division WOR-3 bacterium]|nr:outer membrane beta-barrel protein [candidate division WOR-3 bacterium]